MSLLKQQTMRCCNGLFIKITSSQGTIFGSSAVLHQKLEVYVFNLISLVTSCVGLQEEEPQTPFPMSIIWVFHVAASMLMGLPTLPNQSANHITSHLLHWASGRGTTNSPSHVLYMGISSSHWHAHGMLNSTQSINH